MNKLSWFYIMRLGVTDLYKLGYTTNVEKRLKDINQYMEAPNSCYPDQYHLYSCIFTKEFKTEKEAYNFEQKVFDEVEEYMRLNSINLHVDKESYKIEWNVLQSIFTILEINL